MKPSTANPWAAPGNEIRRQSSIVHRTSPKTGLHQTVARTQRRAIGCRCDLKSRRRGMTAFYGAVPCAVPTPRRSAQRAAQFLRHVKQRLVVLHQMHGAVDARHRGGRDLATQVERDEAIEDRLVALAELPFVVVRADPEVECMVAATGIVIDDAAH